LEEEEERGKKKTDKRKHKNTDSGVFSRNETQNETPFVPSIFDIQNVFEKGIDYSDHKTNRNLCLSYNERTKNIKKFKSKIKKINEELLENTLCNKDIFRVKRIDFQKYSTLSIKEVPNSTKIIPKENLSSEILELLKDGKIHKINTLSYQLMENNTHVRSFIDATDDCLEYVNSVSIIADWIKSLKNKHVSLNWLIETLKDYGIVYKTDIQQEKEKETSWDLLCKEYNIENEVIQVPLCKFCKIFFYSTT
jgi:hypothetical protein